MNSTVTYSNESLQGVGTLSLTTITGLRKRSDCSRSMPGLKHSREVNPNTRRFGRRDRKENTGRPQRKHCLALEFSHITHQKKIINIDLINSSKSNQT